MLPLLSNDHQARNLLTGLARHLREAELESLGAAPGDAAAASASLRARLAHAMLRLAMPDPQLIAVIDLRLFARLRLRECATLLQQPPRDIASAWRRMRQALACPSRSHPVRSAIPPSRPLD